MPHPKVLARGLLLSCAAILLVAAPVLVTLPPAGPDMVQHGDPTPSATGTPANPGIAKLARPPASFPRQAATTVVISEFRTRGPSSNGYASDEFIELFNPTAGEIDIGGWSLWRSPDCTPAEDQFHTFAGGTILQPGQHWLVGGLNYSGGIAPDELDPVDIGVDDQGGIALKDASIIPAVVDMVGMCDETFYFETDPLLALSGNVNQSYDRKTETGGECTDSGNNLADFFLRTPSDPQNSDSLVAICGNPTPEPPPTATRTATAPPPPRVVINELGWGGTGASSADQWIELFNAGGSPADLDGWTLEAPNTAFEVVLQGTIPANGYFLLVWGTSAQATATPDSSVCVGFNNRTYDQIFSRHFSDTGEVIYLKEGNVIRDIAGQTLTNWWAGTAGPPPRSMERTGPPALSSIPTNSQTAWFTYGRTAGTARDCDNNPVFGTPKESNWAVTVTRTPGPTARPPRTPTPRPPTPFAHMLINEFLPRAGTDWNGDGAVNVYDEFIEIKNNGPIDGNLEGWKLDDAADLGSPAFTLPNVILKPGERAVFYGLTTRILLEDSGDTVRLINPQGAVIDGRTYGVIETLDISHCRIPDGYYWRTACFSTPGNENALTGVAPAPAPIVVGARAPCLLPDTAPEPFRQAECEAYGEDMWDRTFWDEPEPAVFIVHGIHTKWKTSIE